MSEVWAVTDIDFDHFVAVRNKIEYGLRERLSTPPKKPVSTAEKALRCLLGNARFDDLVGELATAAVVYEAGSNPATFDSNIEPHFALLAAKRGRPPRPEVQALLVDIRNAINGAINVNVGLYQNEGGAEGIAVEVARIVALSVGKLMSGDVRKQIGKARKVKPTFDD